MADSPSSPGSRQTPATQPAGGVGPPPPTYGMDGDVHILDRLAVLYRYRRIAITVFVLTTAALMIQGYSTIPVYQAKAQIEIDAERATALPGITTPDNTYYEDPDPYYKTQYRIIKGRELTRRVARKLNLAAQPEFNGTERPRTTPFTMLHDAEQRALKLVRPQKEEVVEAPKVDEAPDESGLVSAFIGRVGVSPITGSKLVEVTFESSNPKFAATAANTLVDEYVESNLEIKQLGTQNMIEWLDKELAKQLQKVQESERAMASYRERQNALSLDDKQNLVGARLNKLNDDSLAAHSRRLQKELLYNQVKGIQPGQSLESNQTISQNPAVIVAKSKVNELQKALADLSARYLEKHPSVQKARSDLAEGEKQYQFEVQRAAQTIENEYRSAVIEEQTIARGLDNAKADAQDLSKKSVDYNMMQRDAQTNRTIYDTLLARQKELTVSSNSRANNVRVIDHAELPNGPMTPTGRRTWLLALAVGFAIAVAVAYGLDYMNDTIKTPEDVTRRLKLPFLGLVPSVRGDKHPLLASSRVPHDFGESFRALRTSLVSKYPGTGTKVLLVTSAQPLEGKTTTAANVAMALAYGGSRVLLIDADMRRPGLHRPLRLTNERGLSQVLIGQARVRDVIQRTVDPNLLAITAGKTPPNPSELLSSERMKTLLTNLTHGPFDWIIIDTPPVLAVTDAVILAPWVSGVTFVIGAEMTRRRLAERAVETVMQTRPKYAAVVLNKVDFARNKYYYSRYYGHQYKNYYAEAAV
ncbi:MAG TPA: polysaccharide biosynthesis tyrosine autokinase [Vicinamibacterales bacterium]|nr:polysaccharide biosynthesis tyrosine autokinase [Vicinamibacterales bacterium]